jgi:hypothetical protein
MDIRLAGKELDLKSFRNGHDLCGFLRRQAGVLVYVGRRESRLAVQRLGKDEIKK